MATIDQLIRNTEAINFNEVLEDSITDTSKDLVKLQKEQMLEGRNAKGDLIGKYKSDAYARKKHALNAKAGFGNVDLRLKGDFQSEIFVDPRNRLVVIDSGDQKAARLIEKYGAEIFGLNEEKAEGYSKEHLAPAANKRIKELIHK